ncbi:MAG: YggU family protein [Betaproteobacteria bacterium]|nr:YggU family protein [Betaproteobacteria bacterium]
MSAWLRKDAQGWLLAIHAQPGAKRSEVAGLHGDSLKIRIAAPPVEGKANAALIAFLAEALRVPRRSLSVIKGETSRDKLVRVADPRADPAGLLTQQS